MTFPQFVSASTAIQRVQAWRAKNEVFLGIFGAFGDDKARKTLFDLAGGFETEEAIDYNAIDESAMKVAQERMRKALEELKNVGSGEN